jgi:hypothetical protein
VFTVFFSAQGINPFEQRALKGEFMRISPAIALLIFVSVMTGICGESSTFPDDSVRAIARSSLTAFLDKIPVGRESGYGFHNRDEFSRASPGIPLQVYTAKPDSAGEGTGDSSNHPIAVDEWRVPVLVGGELRTLLTVARVDSNLEAVELGGAALAREFGEFEKKYPGGRRALLRLYQLKCDFMMIDRTGAGLREGEYHPLRSARLVFNAGTASPRSRRELFDEIHRLYRQRPADR